MRICKECGKEFEKPVKGSFCSPCRYNKYNKGIYDYEYFKSRRKKSVIYDKGLLSKSECMRWIAKQYDNKFMTYYTEKELSPLRARLKKLGYKKYM